MMSLINIQQGVNYYGTDPRCQAVAESINKIAKFTVTSGYRTAEYNAKVGGAKGSAHVLKLAIDGFCKDWHCIKIANHIMTNFPDIKGIGIDVYRNCIHFDFMDRGAVGVTVWCYDREGKAI
jgi:uncharacterized protein YcbK (DUF882 family)